MITIDTNLYLIASKFNISPKRLSEYGDKSIDEIMQAEAAQGNTKAAQFSQEVLSNPDKLVELFKLSNANNRYEILQNLNESDLNRLLPLLEKEDLVAGLNFFTKDKLLDLLSKIPKKDLVKYVLELFSPEQLMKLMPEKQMDKLLMATELDKGLVLKHLKALPPAILAQMIEQATGQPVKSMNQHDLINQMGALPADKYKTALISMPTNKKREFILNLVKEEPKLFQLFDADAYAKILDRKEKPDLVKAAKVIEPEQLIKMMGSLPEDLLAVVVTQIDPSVFAEALIKDYKEILKQIVAV